MIRVKEQVVAGVVPPEVGEAIIREVWPSIAAKPGLARLGETLLRTIVLSPLVALFFLAVRVPAMALSGRRYTLTNRRLMVGRGMKARPVEEVPLAAINDVRVVPETVNHFYRAGTLEVLSKDRVVLTLAGVPEPESFRHAIRQACEAWVPRKAAAEPFVPAKATAGPS